MNMPSSRVAEVMQFHGQNPPYISMHVFSVLALTSVLYKAWVVFGPAFTSHKGNIFLSFYVFPISATPPTNSSKKEENYLVPKSTHYLGCPVWWSIFDRAIFRGFRFRLGPLDYKLPTLGGILFFLFHSSTTTVLLNTSI